MVADCSRRVVASFSFLLISNGCGVFPGRGPNAQASRTGDLASESAWSASFFSPSLPVCLSFFSPVLYAQLCFRHFLLLS